LQDSSPAKVRDVWVKKDLGALDSYSATVPAEDMVLLVVNGNEGPLKKYEMARGAGDRGATVRGNSPATFKNVGSRFTVAPVAISYINPDKSPRFAELRVNGRIATRIAFPSTGGSSGTVWIEALLDREGAKNELEFSVLSDPGPVIESISLQ
jgi:hypothetical protein